MAKIWSRYRKSKPPGRPSKKVGNFPSFPRGNSRDLAATATGYSTCMINKAEYVVDAAKKKAASRKDSLHDE